MYEIQYSSFINKYISYKYKDKIKKKNIDSNYLKYTVNFGHECFYVSSNGIEKLKKIKCNTVEYGSSLFLMNEKRIIKKREFIEQTNTCYKNNGSYSIRYNIAEESFEEIVNKIKTLTKEGHIPSDFVIYLDRYEIALNALLNSDL